MYIIKTPASRPLLHPNRSKSPLMFPSARQASAWLNSHSLGDGYAVARAVHVRRRKLAPGYAGMRPC